MRQWLTSCVKQETLSRRVCMCVCVTRLDEGLPGWIQAAAGQYYTVLVRPCHAREQHRYPGRVGWGKRGNGRGRDVQYTVDLLHYNNRAHVLYSPPRVRHSLVHTVLLYGLASPQSLHFPTDFHFGEPSSLKAAVPTHQLSRLASRHTVLPCNFIVSKRRRMRCGPVSAEVYPRWSRIHTAGYSCGETVGRWLTYTSTS